MPFKSEKQRRFLWLKHPDIAKRWAHEYPNQKNLPTYARETDNKETDKSESKKAMLTPATSSAIAILRRSIQNYAQKSAQFPGLFAQSLSVNTPAFPTEKSALIAKKSISIIEELNVPHSEKPVAAGDEHVTVKREKKDDNHAKNRDSMVSSVEKAFNLADEEIQPTLQKLGGLLGKYAAVIRLGKKHTAAHPDYAPGPKNVGVDANKLRAGVEQYKMQRAYAQQQAMMFPPANSGKSQPAPAPVATYPGMQSAPQGQVAANQASMQSPATNPVGMKGPLNTRNGVPTFAQNLTGNASFGKGSA
jgi:hypothetical protein